MCVSCRNVLCVLSRSVSLTHTLFRTWQKCRTRAGGVGVACEKRPRRGEKRLSVALVDLVHEHVVTGSPVSLVVFRFFTKNKLFRTHKVVPHASLMAVFHPSETLADSTSSPKRTPAFRWRLIKCAWTSPVDAVLMQAFHAIMVKRGNHRVYGVGS